MAHVFGDKVRPAYDQSQMLDEWRKFMFDWCDALLTLGMKVLCIKGGSLKTSKRFRYA